MNANILQYRLPAFAAFFLCCLYSGSFASTRPHVQDAVFAIRPDNVKYLRYLRYENIFDTATVAYTFGEIRLKYGSQVKRISLSTFSGELNALTGEASQGEDPALLKLGTSETFQVPSTPDVEIEFYRDLEVYAPCGTTKGGNSGGGTGTWEDSHWAVGANRILDKTEWVLQVVRASDNTVLDVLDSVGVLPNPTSLFATRYGTTPNRTNHLRTLSSPLAGTEVYLRVSPRRYGSTPVGISLNKTTSWISLSTVVEYAPTTKRRCTPEEVAYLHNQYFDELLAVTDSSMLATGDTPNLYFILHNSEQTSIYRQRYLVDKVVNGISMRMVKDSTDFASEYWGIPLEKTGASQNSLGSSFYIQNIVPNPNSGGTVAVQFYGRTSSAIVLDVYDVQSRKIGTVWSGVVGEQTVAINTQDLSDGVYFLVLSNENGVRIDAKQIIIKR